MPSENRAKQKAKVGTAQLDWLSDFVIPAAVFGLLGSILYFLIDLRQYLFGGEAAILRYVVFWFLIGVIGLARLSARPGSSTTPPIMYAAALAGAVGWVTVALTNYEGSFVAGGSRASHAMAVLMNLAIVAGIWAAAWLLTGLCTKPEHALEELRSGGVASSRGYRAVATAPLRAVLITTGLAVAIFGFGLAAINPASPARAHAFVCAALFLFFALLLMALVTVGAARLAAHQDGLRVRGQIVATWIGGAAAIAAATLVLALVLPEAASKLAARPEAAGVGSGQYLQQGRGLGTRYGSSSWVDRLPGGAKRMVERLMQGRQRRPGAPPHQGQGRGQVEQRMPQPKLARPPDAHWLIWLLLALAVIAAIYFLRRYIAAAVRAAWSGLRRMLAAIAALLARLTRILRRSARPAEDTMDLADILALGLTEAMAPEVAVRRLWRAVEAFYSAVGPSRQQYETELEFARRVSGRYALRAEDVRLVARLYCACEYGGASLGPEVGQQMRAVWERLVAAVSAAREAQRLRRAG